MEQVCELVKILREEMLGVLNIHDREGAPAGKKDTWRQTEEGIAGPETRIMIQYNRRGGRKDKRVDEDGESTTAKLTRNLRLRYHYNWQKKAVVPSGKLSKRN